MERSSRVSGFYNLTMEERLNFVKEWGGLSSEEANSFNVGYGSLERVNLMIENVIGVIGIPVGIATNFLINGKDYLIPMATEEPSVVAAASNGARMAREKGGFFTKSTGNLMAAQIQLTNVKHPNGARAMILENKEKFLKMANTQDKVLTDIGGGARDLEVRLVEGWFGTMVITHLIVDVGDAMGANTVNHMAEHIAPEIENLTGGKVYLRVVDNLAVHRLARARCVVDKNMIGGEKVVDGIIHCYDCAYHDPHRATGHNKGTMNGISAVVLATCNDTRAMESAFHSYAAINGQYRALPTWEKNSDGDLVGTLEIPIAIGLVGGATKVHPVAQACIKILGVKTARELGEVLAAVGLSQKLAAERALASEGLEPGHTRMRARNVAVEAGAKGKYIEIIAKQMIEENRVRADRARELVQKYNKK
jgi:hydroxymethylglutaryl-CoA reductase